MALVLQKLLEKPEHADLIFQKLDEIGLSSECCIFGGAIRDVDYAAKYNIPIKIKDYDIRIWTNKDINDVIQLLISVFGPVTICQSRGTLKLRYIFYILESIELDISIRTIPNNDNVNAAQDRALNSNVGLCSIAILRNGECWAKQEYQNDRDNKTLTIFGDCPLEYLQKIQTKFPNHQIKN